MFCSKCGREVNGYSKFCQHCGTQLPENVVASSNQTVPAYQQNTVPIQNQQVQKKPKKKNGMKTTGIVLICLQILGIFGGIVNGSLFEMFRFGNIPELIGYFLLGIIGVILLVVAYKKEKQ